MKVYEYLAAGLPVVATPLPALDGRRGGPHGLRRRGDRRACSTGRSRGQPRAPRRALARGRGALVGPAPGGDRRGDRRPVRDLLVTTHTPVLRSGQAVRTYGVARALAAHRGLDLLYVRFGADRARRGVPRDPGDRAARGRCPRAAHGALLAYARCAPGAACRAASRAASLPSWPQRASALAGAAGPRARDRRRADRGRRAARAWRAGAR